MDDIVIVSAARTPVGSFSGALGTLPAHALGAVALQAAFERAGVEGGDVDEVIPDKGMVRIITTIFGRPTPLELEYWQIEKM